MQPNFPHRHSKAAIFTSSLNRSHRTFPVHYNLKNLKERSNSSISKNSSSFISKTSPKQGTHHVTTKKKKKPHGYKATGENLQLITNLLQMRLHGRRELVEIPQRRKTPTRWPWVEKRGDVIHGHQKKENRKGRRETRSEGKENHKKKRIEATTTSCMATKAPEDTGSELKTHCRQKTTTTTTTLASLRRFFPLKYKQVDAPVPIYISFRFSLSGTFQQQPNRRRNSEKTRSMIGSYGVPCHVPIEVFSWPTGYGATSEFCGYVARFYWFYSALPANERGACTSSCRSFDTTWIFIYLFIIYLGFF